MNFITGGIEGGVKLTQWKINGKDCLLCSKEKKTLQVNMILRLEIVSFQI